MLLPTKIEQEKLAYGYIRENCTYTVPIVLIKLCLLYMNNIFYWNVKVNDLKKQGTMDSNELIITVQFQSMTIMLNSIYYLNFLWIQVSNK